MKTVSVEMSPVNVTALDYDLRMSLTNHFYGLTYDGKDVVLVLDDAVTSEQMRQAQTVVETHDATKLAPNQQAELDRKAKLDQARKEVGGVGLDTKAFSSQPALIQQLAQKIAWLEQELVEQKGGTAA